MNNKVTKQELTQMEEEAWEQFQVKYPTITDDRWYLRVLRVFFSGGVTRAMHENAWLKGYEKAWDRATLLFQSSPPAPKSDQPESPEPRSSSHSQGGGFPDANPSK